MKLQKFAEDEKTFTQEEVNELIAQREAELKEENDKLFNDKWDKKYAKYKEEEQKKIDEAKRLAEMSATERLEEEKKQLQNRLAELEADRTLSEMKSTARSILKESNVPVDENVLNVLCTTDADKTKKAIESFAKMYNEAVENGVKEALKGNVPSAPSTNTLTKEQIMAVKDTVERQRLIRENAELFK